MPVRKMIPATESEAVTDESRLGRLEDAHSRVATLAIQLAQRLEALMGLLISHQVIQRGDFSLFLKRYGVYEKELARIQSLPDIVARVDAAIKWNGKVSSGAFPPEERVPAFLLYLEDLDAEKLLVKNGKPTLDEKTAMVILDALPTTCIIEEVFRKVYRLEKVVEPKPVEIAEGVKAELHEMSGPERRRAQQFLPASLFEPELSPLSLPQGFEEGLRFLADLPVEKRKLALQIIEEMLTAPRGKVWSKRAFVEPLQSGEGSRGSSASKLDPVLGSPLPVSPDEKKCPPVPWPQPEPHTEWPRLDGKKSEEEHEKFVAEEARIRREADKILLRDDQTKEGTTE